jgi:hypothetical protein
MREEGRIDRFISPRDRLGEEWSAEKGAGVRQLLWWEKKVSLDEEGILCSVALGTVCMVKEGKVKNSRGWSP